MKALVNRAAIIKFKVYAQSSQGLINFFLIIFGFFFPLYHVSVSKPDWFHYNQWSCWDWKWHDIMHHNAWYGCHEILFSIFSASLWRKKNASAKCVNWNNFNANVGVTQHRPLFFIWFHKMIIRMIYLLMIQH